jgi:D-alanyl-D-alanine carboxypeptidase
MRIGRISFRGERHSPLVESDIHRGRRVRELGGAVLTLYRTRMARAVGRSVRKGWSRVESNRSMRRTSQTAPALLVTMTLAAMGALLPAGAASQPPAKLVHQLQHLLDAEVEAHASIPGQLLHLHAPAFSLDVSLAAGLRDRTSGVPLEPHHSFRIASVTKTFTAAAVLRLAEEDRLQLDRSIRQYLSAPVVKTLQSGGYSTDAITVRHLLTHTSGIYDYATDARYVEAVLQRPFHRWTREEQIARAMAWGVPQFEPGEGYHYSDTGYILLGEILERLSGRSLADTYRTLLDFAGLSLDRTFLETLEPAPPRAGDRSHAYFGELDTSGFDPSFDLYGGGGLVSSVDELARFYRRLLTGSVYRHDSTLRTMLSVPDTNQTAPGGPYAMGIQQRQIAGSACWGHTGVWGSSAFHCPELDVTIVRHYGQAQPEEAFFFNRLYEQIAELLGLQDRRRLAA